MSSIRFIDPYIGFDVVSYSTSPPNTHTHTLSISMAGITMAKWMLTPTLHLLQSADDDGFR